MIGILAQIYDDAFIVDEIVFFLSVFIFNIFKYCGADFVEAELWQTLDVQISCRRNGISLSLDFDI